MKNNTVKLPSNRNFGIVFFIVFFIIAIWPLLNGHEIRFWSFCTSSENKGKNNNKKKEIKAKQKEIKHNE